MTTVDADQKLLTCFVIMPFGAGEQAHEHRDRFEAIVVSAVEFYNEHPDRPREMVLQRADDSDNVGRVSASIIENLRHSELVIADLKGLNPNVMYELGIRHSVRNGTIILVPEDQPPPFDVQDFYVVKYGARAQAAKNLADRLMTLARMLVEDTPIEDSPVLGSGLEAEKLPDLKLGRLGRTLADVIGRSLICNTNWTTGVPGDNRVGQFSRTFEERSRHFDKEKDFIAGKLADFLWERCTRIVRADDRRPTRELPKKPHKPDARRVVTTRKVYLVLDSGTTLIPLFSALATRALKEHKEGDPDLLQNIEVVTNNLPGLGELAEHGCPEPRQWSDPVLKCQLLPGIPMPVYSAVAGTLTEEALRNLKKKSQDRGENAVFIGVLTGNWVRVRRHQLPRCPVPMARGKWHQRFKQVLVDVCDECYVLAALGKVVVDQGENDFNKVLGYSDAAGKKVPERVPYRDVTIDDVLARRVRLVSTKRPDGYLLSHHGHRVTAVLENCASVEHALRKAGEQIADIPHMIEEFGDVPESPYREFMAEFPHEHTRKNADFLKMFKVTAPGDSSGSPPALRRRPAAAVPGRLPSRGGAHGVR